MVALNKHVSGLLNVFVVAALAGDLNAGGRQNGRSRESLIRHFEASKINSRS